MPLNVPFKVLSYLAFHLSFPQLFGLKEAKLGTFGERHAVIGKYNF